jgi:cytoskeletal protein CcmA (bactofilin family)
MFWRTKKRTSQVVGATNFSIGSTSAGATTKGGAEIPSHEGIAQVALDDPGTSGSAPAAGGVLDGIPPSRGVVGGSDRFGGSTSGVSPGPLLLSAQPVERVFVIPRGYRVTGAVFLPQVGSTLRVEGELAGRGLVARTVVVAAGGELRQPAEVDRLVVEGRVSAQIVARGEVELRSGGEVRGIEMEAEVLTVRPGGVLSGCAVSVGSARHEEPVLDKRAA